nr:hypothetical protein [Paenibacillus donghaensis]
MHTEYGDKEIQVPRDPFG